MSEHYFFAAKSWETNGMIIITKPKNAHYKINVEIMIFYIIWYYNWYTYLHFFDYFFILNLQGIYLWTPSNSIHLHE